MTDLPRGFADAVRRRLTVGHSAASLLMRLERDDRLPPALSMVDFDDETWNAVVDAVIRAVQVLEHRERTRLCAELDSLAKHATATMVAYEQVVTRAPALEAKLPISPALAEIARDLALRYRPPPLIWDAALAAVTSSQKLGELTGFTRAVDELVDAFLPRRVMSTLGAVALNLPATKGLLDERTMMKRYEERVRAARKARRG